MEVETVPEDGDPRAEISEHFVRADAKCLVERAKGRIAKDGGIPPCVVVYCTVDPLDGVTKLNATNCAVPLILAGEVNDASKAEMISKARAVAVAGHAAASVLMLDAWVVIGDIGEQLEAKPSEHPRRKEALVSVIEWRTTTEIESTMMTYERDQGFVDFDEPVTHTGARDGMMLQVMMPPTAEITDRTRQLARDFCRAFLMSVADYRRAHGKEVARG